MAAARELSGGAAHARLPTFSLVDHAGQPLRPAMIWADQRAAAEADEFSAAFGDEEAYRVTGNRVAATYNIPKLMWLQRHEPDVVARAYRAIGHKDYVNARLTGIIVTDTTDASSTAAYDLAAGSWSDQVITASGVESRLMPLVVESTRVLGPLTRPAAEALGLTPVEATGPWLRPAQVASPPIRPATSA